MLKVINLTRPLGQCSRLQISVIHMSENRQVKLFSSFSQPKSCSRLTSILDQKTNSSVALLKPITFYPATQIGVRWMSGSETETKIVSELEFSSQDLASAIPEVLSEPSFQSLGLAHAYPSGWLQAFMEQIHLQFDIPWWGTIVISK